MTGRLFKKVEDSMTIKTALVASLVSAFMVGVTPRVAHLQAPTGPSCSKYLDQLDRDTRAFQAEADRMGMKMFHDDTIGPALGSLKKNLTATKNETVQTVREVKAKKAEFDDWRNTIGGYRDQMENIKQCFAKGNACNLSKLLDDVNDALREWIQSLEQHGTSAAAERVSRGADLYQKYTSRLLSTAQGSASAGLDACVTQLEQRAQQTQASRLTPMPAGAKKNPAHSGGGPGVGTWVGIGAAVTGAGVGAAALAARAQDATGDCKMEIGNAIAGCKTFGCGGETLAAAKQCCASLNKSYTAGETACR